MPLATFRKRRDDETPPETPQQPAAPPRAEGPHPDDVEALGRVLASEAGAHRYTHAERVAIGWAVRNRAARYRSSVYALLAPLGREQRGSDPPMSTAQVATAADYVTARDVLTAAKTSDPTHGAGAFFEPEVQTIAVERGRMYRSDPKRYAAFARFAKYHRTVEEIRASWGRMLARIGRFEFYR